MKVSKVRLTQNQLLAIAQRLRPEDKWEIDQVATSVLLKEGLAEFGAGDFSAIMKIIKGTAFAGETYGSYCDEPDNELLGIKELTEDDLEKIVAEKLT